MLPARPDLRALDALLPRSPVTRFAPSPTGYLHLGHVVDAIYVWGVARALGGRVRLRIEDHDRTRCRPEYERALLEDLAWLGFNADYDVERQSGNGAAYLDALESLRARGFVYCCRCSRRDVGGERYPGTCRTRGLIDGNGVGLRVRMDRGEERFVDALRGTLVQEPSTQCGDVLVRDRNGHWTYQFAVTVDDIRQNIDLVIRGADLLESTGRQLRLARLLGRTAPPVFLHHPLLVGPDGEKLSKSAGDTGVRQMRAAGMSADEVIGRAALEVGLLTQPSRVRAADVAALLTL